MTVPEPITTQAVDPSSIAPPAPLSVRDWLARQLPLVAHSGVCVAIGALLAGHGLADPGLTVLITASVGAALWAAGTTHQDATLRARLECAEWEWDRWQGRAEAAEARWVRAETTQQERYRALLRRIREEDEAALGEGA